MLKIPPRQAHGRLSRVLRPSIEVIFVEIRLSPTSNEKLIYWLDFRWWECHCDVLPIRHRNIVLIHKTHRTVPRIDKTNYSFHSQMWFSVRMCRFLSEDYVIRPKIFWRIPRRRFIKEKITHLLFHTQLWIFLPSWKLAKIIWKTHDKHLVHIFSRSKCRLYWLNVKWNTSVISELLCDLLRRNVYVIIFFIRQSPVAFGRVRDFSATFGGRCNDCTLIMGFGASKSLHPRASFWLQPRFP